MMKMPSVTSTKATGRRELILGQGPELNESCWRLLSVDDDEVNQEVMRGIFESAGFDLSIAMDGTACLDHISRTEVDNSMPHIVLLDSMMPGKSGMEVCRSLRQKYSTLELPIIMVSCRSTKDEIKAALDEGCNDYVTKPFHRTELVARVSTQMNLLRQVKELRGAIASELNELSTCRELVANYRVELETLSSSVQTDPLEAPKVSKARFTSQTGQESVQQLQASQAKVLSSRARYKSCRPRLWSNRQNLNSNRQHLSKPNLLLSKILKLPAACLASTTLFSIPTMCMAQGRTLPTNFGTQWVYL
jgi:DNA-binding response OmpR family regulator